MWGINKMKTIGKIATIGALVTSLLCAAPRTEAEEIISFTVVGEKQERQVDLETIDEKINELQEKYAQASTQEEKKFYEKELEIYKGIKGIGAVMRGLGEIFGTVAQVVVGVAGTEQDPNVSVKRQQQTYQTELKLLASQYLDQLLNVTNRKKAKNLISMYGHNFQQEAQQSTGLGSEVLPSNCDFRPGRIRKAMEYLVNEVQRRYSQEEIDDLKDSNPGIQALYE